MTLVFNASPLIVLAKAGLLDSVIGLASRAMIPRAVSEEIGRFKDSSDAACVWLGNPRVSSYQCDAPTTSEFVAAWGLGAGESSVISMVEAIPDAIAVLDDLAARRCATALRLKIVGTLGLLLMAKKAGQIQNIRGSLDAIVAAGLFIAPHHLADVIKQAGE